MKNKFRDNSDETEDIVSELDIHNEIKDTHKANREMKEKHKKYNKKVGVDKMEEKIEIVEEKVKRTRKPKVAVIEVVAEPIKEFEGVTKEEFKKFEDDLYDGLMKEFDFLEQRLYKGISAKIEMLLQKGDK